MHPSNLFFHPRKPRPLGLAPCKVWVKQLGQVNRGASRHKESPLNLHGLENARDASGILPPPFPFLHAKIFVMALLVFDPSHRGARIAEDTTAISRLKDTARGRFPGARVQNGTGPRTRCTSLFPFCAILCRQSVRPLASSTMNAVPARYVVHSVILRWVVNRAISLPPVACGARKPLGPNSVFGEIIEGRAKASIPSRAVRRQTRIEVRWLLVGRKKQSTDHVRMLYT